VDFEFEQPIVFFLRSVYYMLQSVCGFGGISDDVCLNIQI